jgi:hypothetical protein
MPIFITIHPVISEVKHGQKDEQAYLMQFNHTADQVWKNSF